MSFKRINKEKYLQQLSALAVLIIVFLCFVAIKDPNPEKCRGYNFFFYC
jgi:hypothetical protein